MYLDTPSSFRSPHLLTPSLGNSASFTLGDGSFFATGTAGVTSIIPKPIPEDIRYLLALLNSSLISFYLISHSPVYRGGYHKFSAPYLKDVPIRRIDFTNKEDVSAHDYLVEAAEEMIRLSTAYFTALEQKEDTRYSLLDSIREISGRIDETIFRLYNISPAEASLVESAHIAFPPGEPSG